MKPTIDKDLFLEYFSDNEKLYDYIIKFLNDTYVEIRELFVNQKISCGVMLPEPATPMTYSVEDACKLKQIMGNWLPMVRKYFNSLPEKAKRYNSLNKSLYTYIPTYERNSQTFPTGSATVINTEKNVKMAMSSLFSFVPCRGTYQLLRTCVKYAGGMLDGGMIGAIFNDNIQNENMIFPPEIYHKVLPIDKSSSLADTKDVSIVHFLNSPTKPWQMSDEEFDQHWGKHECMKQYKKCLDAVREKKNKLKKLIETSKLLMNQEIENINKSLGI